MVSKTDQSLGVDAAVLDVHRLRLLRELDRRGTLAAVARALSYSPSAISQQLSQLEAEAGVTLLEPAGRGVRLTPQARILVEHTEAILERLEEAEAELRAAATEVRGTLRVASFQSVLFALIPSVLTRLAERHPGLRVEITYEQRCRRSRACSRTTSTWCSARSTRGWRCRRSPAPAPSCCANDELFLVLPARGPYALDPAGDGPFRLADLAGAPWILDPADTAPARWARNACREAGFEPTSATRALTCCSRSCWPRRGTPYRSSPGCCCRPCLAPTRVFSASPAARTGG